MFWTGVAITAAAIAAWQWMSRKPAAPPQQRYAQPRIAAGGAGVAAAASPAGLEAMRRRMAECGVSARDLEIANKWSADYLGSTLTLRTRLETLLTQIPQHQWPDSAKRVWCAFR